MRWPYKVVKNTPLGTFSNKNYPDWISVGYLNNIFGGGGNLLKDFLEVPELNAILNLRARAMASGKTDAISKVTQTPQAANQSLVRILRRPNWFQGEKEFWRQSSLWRDIFGNEYIYFLTPVGVSRSFFGMFTLNPGMISIEYKPEKGQYFNNATSEGVKYFYTVNGKKIELDKESLIHLNDNRVQSTNILTGTSKIDSLQPAIKNIRDAYNKRNIGLNMPIGVITNNSSGDGIGQVLPMEPKEKEEAMRALKARGAHPILTNLNVDFSGFEISSSKLGLFEETRESTGRICDAYGIPYELLASQKGVTFANLKEAKKQMYEETIVPDVSEKDSALNNHIGAEALSWEIKTDFTHLPVFAEDEKNKAGVDKINMAGVDQILKMPITENGKVILLIDTYGYTKEMATQIVKPANTTPQ